MTVVKIYPQELIGRIIIIVRAADQQWVGCQVKVIDESKNCLKVYQNGKIKTLLKRGLSFRLSTGKKIISGQEIARRPEERIKGK